MLKDSLADLGSNLVDGLLELSSDGLTLEGLDSVRVGGSGHNDEGNDSHLGLHALQSVVESYSRQRSTTRGRRGDLNSRARDSMNISTPLFLNSYRPAVNK